MEYFISSMLWQVRSIWNHRWYAMAVTWCVAVAGFAVVYLLPNAYQSSARVYVDTQSILKPLLSGMTSMPNVQQQVSIMSRTLLSRPNVERVIRMADLDVHSSAPGQHEQQVARLQARIKISGTSSQDIYTISYSDDDAAQVFNVVQSFMTLFVEGSFKGKRGDSDQAVQFLDQQIAHYEARLRAAENSLKQFKIANAGVLPRLGADFGTQLAGATDALGAAQLELAEAQQTRHAILQQINGGASANASVRSVNLELDTRLADVNKQLDTMRMQYTEHHPDVIGTRRLLAQLEGRQRQERQRGRPASDPGLHFSPMLQQLKVAMTEAEGRIAATGVRVLEYSARVQRLREQSERAPEVEAQLAQLNRDYSVNQEQYEKLLAKREAARLSGDLSSTTDMRTFKIIDPPGMPQRPSGPNRPWLYCLVMGAALACGAAAALAISSARPTFGSAADLREVTGLTVLGSVSLYQNAQASAAHRADLQRFGASGAAVLMVFAALLATG